MAMFAKRGSSVRSPSFRAINPLASRGINQSPDADARRLAALGHDVEHHAVAQKLAA